MSKNFFEKIRKNQKKSEKIGKNRKKSKKIEKKLSEIIRKIINNTCIYVYRTRAIITRS